MAWPDGVFLANVFVPVRWLTGVERYRRIRTELGLPAGFLWTDRDH